MNSNNTNWKLYNVFLYPSESYPKPYSRVFLLGLNNILGFNEYILMMNNIIIGSIVFIFSLINIVIYYYTVNFI